MALPISDPGCDIAKINKAARERYRSERNSIMCEHKVPTGWTRGDRVEISISKRFRSFTITHPADYLHGEKAADGYVAFVTFKNFGAMKSWLEWWFT